MINIGVLGLKAFTGLWALITFAVAAALQSKFFGTSDSVGAIIAAGVLTMLWIIISSVFPISLGWANIRLVLQFVMRETIIISVMVDTIVYGILFVLALGMSITSACTDIRWNSCRVEECRYLSILQQI